jgi:hypothetical protein
MKKRSKRSSSRAAKKASSSKKKKGRISFKKRGSENPPTGEGSAPPETNSPGPRLTI